MIERKSTLIRLRADAEQAALFRKAGGCTRLVKNLALEQRNAFSRPGRRIGYDGQRAERSALKDAAPFLRGVPHHCRQEALVDLDKAFTNVFAGRAPYPKRQPKRDRCSIRFPDPKQFRIEGDTMTPDKTRSRKGREVVLHPPKAGAVKGVMHRALPDGARLKSVTISSDGDRSVAALLYEREVTAPEDRSQQAVVGNDLGAGHPAALSTGAGPQLPRVTARQRERERRLHKSLSRKKKGSNNRRKAVRALARRTATQAWRRKNAREKLTTRDRAPRRGV